MGGQLQRGACDTSGDRADHLRGHVPVGNVPKGHGGQVGFAMHKQLRVLSWLQLYLCFSSPWGYKRQAGLDQVQKSICDNSQHMEPTSDMVINANLGPGLGVRDSGN